MVNTPGGGVIATRRRPDLVPGVDPYIKDGGLLFLNPAAFATPKPGTFGNLERNSIHGPDFRQMDMVVAKTVPSGRGPTASSASRCSTCSTTTNFANPPATLPNALPSDSADAKRTSVQPGQAVHARRPPARVRRLASTVGTTVGLGTNRQVQLAFRLNF